MTVCEVLTAATLAVNDVLVEPEAIDTLAGREIALLVLARATFKELEGAGLTDRAHAARPAPLKESGEQVNAVNAGSSTADTGGTRDTETDLVMLP